MDLSKGAKRKLGVLSNMWKRCKSFKKGMKVAPAPVGYFPIYVGPEKERFMIKTEHVNHPLFKSLLEEAESEYGYGHKSLLMLPCQVDRFVNVLMDCDDDDDQQIGCTFVGRTQSSNYHFLTPPTPTALAR
ncbi:auxin-induced protein 15A-like [Salvia miltiorrhiza]|uniref:auxin-induced protein 15A-like n=1 Tax=Salvia miltiorrhiza TaxID=226208 RepID=UPI0025ABB71B|nr:auxin-induced protein 15A-like [Salvia miltiorrhiza]